MPKFDHVIHIKTYQSFVSLLIVDYKIYKNINLCIICCKNECYRYKFRFVLSLCVRNDNLLFI